MMNLDHTPMKLEGSTSHSWWWDSHNSPKNSRWLQSNLQDLDEKVKGMLKLIEEDADSFAQRAEMYYQKRPELLSLVEEFYRAYRSLAERYDHLTGEIKQNVPRALQLQFGLSCDSPRTAPVGGNLLSPLRKGHQTFDSLLKKAGQSEEQVQAEVIEIGTDACKENDFSLDDVLSSSSDSEGDNLPALQKLQQELQAAENENRVLLNNHQHVLELNATLRSRLKRLQEDHARTQEEAILLQNKVDELNKELSILKLEKAMQPDEPLTRSKLEKDLKDADTEEVTEEMEYSKNSMMGTGVVDCPCRKLTECVLQEECRNVKDEVLNLTKENERLCTAAKAAAEYERAATTALKFLRAVMFGVVQRSRDVRKNLLAKVEETGEKAQKELSRLRDENITMKNEIDSLYNGEEQRVNDRLELLQKQVTNLVEENRKQKVALLGMAEEKREAIRQLCFSMDVLMNKNQRLQLALGFVRKKSHNAHNAPSANRLPDWMKVFFGAWTGPKSQHTSFAL